MIILKMAEEVAINEIPNSTFLLVEMIYTTKY